MKPKIANVRKIYFGCVSSRTNAATIQPITAADPYNKNDMLIRSWLPSIGSLLA